MPGRRGREYDKENAIHVLNRVNVGIRLRGKPHPNSSVTVTTTNLSHVMRLAGFSTQRRVRQSLARVVDEERIHGQAICTISQI